MHLVTVYAPDGETFEVPQSRMFGLLVKGWTLVKPAASQPEPAKPVEEAPRTFQRKPAKPVEQEEPTAVEVSGSPEK